MENFTPKPEGINQSAIDAIEKQIREIDLEIVNEPNITPSRLAEICGKKLTLSREVALLRGEKIKRGSDTSFS